MADLFKCPKCGYKNYYTEEDILARSREADKYMFRINEAVEGRGRWRRFWRNIKLAFGAVR
jgi:hypothetical protein